MKKKIPSEIKLIQKQPVRELNFASGEASISFSQIQLYNDCPRKWELMYKEGYKIYAPSIHLIFGTAFHETFQDYLQVFYDKSGVEADLMDLEDIFKTKLSDLYKKEYAKNKDLHFSSPEELGEFYEDGIAILGHLKKKRGEYFSKRGWHLVGIEMPLMIKPVTEYNVLFRGFIDLVLFHEGTKEYTIMDFKTSKSGWYAKDKMNDVKKSQLILYKEYFSKQYNVDSKKIGVEFFIVKRKLWENCDFPQKRVQSFVPPSGKNKTDKALNMVEDFLRECFNKNGTYINKSHEPKINGYCKYCPWFEDKLCSATYKER